MRPEHLYLSEMLEAVDDIASFVDGLTLDRFLTDRKTQYAIVFALQSIGEAARHLPDSLRDEYPEIPWHEMIGQRNVIAHGYFALRWEDIWETAVRDVPALREPLVAIQTRLTGENGK